jgi:hypothetical protein
MSEAKTGFPYLINGKHAQTNDQTPSSAKVLADAGFEPADDYVLDLSSGTAEFFAFEGGTVFELTVNEHTVFWGAATISGREVRHLANVPPEDELVWIRDNSTNVVVSEEEALDLSTRGVEHLRTQKRPIEPHVYRYFVNGIEYSTEHERLTGAQITARIPDWNPANSLVLESEGSAPDEVIHSTTVVELKGRTSPAYFTIVPPATFGRA